MCLQLSSDGGGGQVLGARLDQMARDPLAPSERPELSRSARQVQGPSGRMP
jgi:hypothetical protein